MRSGTDPRACGRSRAHVHGLAAPARRGAQGRRAMPSPASVSSIPSTVEVKGQRGGDCRRGRKGRPPRCACSTPTTSASPSTRRPTRPTSRRSPRCSARPCLPQAPSALPRDRRGKNFLTQPVFHENRSETEMMRFLRRLADKDLALDRAMIPLGSCTMKLNAAAEMMPVSWPSVANLHPFAPAAHSRRLPRHDRRSGALARRNHRLRRRLAAAQCRQPGRICRPAGDPPLPRVARRGATATSA